MSLLYLTLLFVVLSPGVLLTIPPCSKGLFMSRQTSLLAVAVHAAVFYLVATYVLPELTSRQMIGSEGFSKTTEKIADGAKCDTPWKWGEVGKFGCKTGSQCVLGGKKGGWVCWKGGYGDTPAPPDPRTAKKK
jgi:hypothetical protein